MRRSGLSLILLGLLLGSAVAQPMAAATAAAQAQAQAQAAAIPAGDAASMHAALVSGVRAKFLRKHPHLAKHLVPPSAVSAAPGSAVTPTAVPVQCLSVAELAIQAGNFTTLLAAAQVKSGWALLCRAVLLLLLLLRSTNLPTRLALPLTAATRCLPPHLPLLQAAGLAAALSDRSLKATVFAPTDAAFAAALEALGVTAEELLAQPELLAAVSRGVGLQGRGLSGWLACLPACLPFPWAAFPLIPSPPLASPPSSAPSLLSPLLTGAQVPRGPRAHHHRPDVRHPGAAHPAGC